MTEEDRQWFETIEPMLDSHAWKLFETYVTQCQDAISKGWRTIKPEDVRFIQGRFDGLNQIIEFKNVVASLKALAVEQDDLEPPPL